MYKLMEFIFVDDPKRKVTMRIYSEVAKGLTWQGAKALRRKHRNSQIVRQVL